MELASLGGEGLAGETRSPGGPAETAVVDALDGRRGEESASA